MDHTTSLRSRIAAHRSEVAARRARAYVDCPDLVLGFAVRPVSPASWTLLHATGNRLVTGGTPLEGDLRNYLWFHSPLFALSRHLTGWRLRLLKWVALLPFSILLHRRRDWHWYTATLALAGAEIKGHLHDALADAPVGNSDCAPGPCLQAQFEHWCALHYGWAPAITREQPLRQLFQLLRSAAKADDDDEGERQIRFAHLRERNAAHLNSQPSALNSQL